jgi:hypothetical protein
MRAADIARGARRAGLVPHRVATSDGAERGVLGTEEITVEEVLRAGRVLFGPAFAADAHGWRDVLKQTYRRRAMETHPDRARALGRPERELAREFEAISDAYRILSGMRAASPARGPARAPRPAARPPREPERARRGPTPPGAPGAPGPGARRAGGPVPPPPAAPAGGPRVRVGVRPEDLPRRRLRFAEYLYYSGRVRWTDLVDAIAWQRAQRPPIGRIAVDLGFLRPDDVGVILERRRLAAANAIPFGEWAVRIGRMTPYQVLVAVGHQLRRQRPIGQFFVDRGVLDADEVEAIRQRILRHNVRFGADR